MNPLQLRKRVDALIKAINPFTILFWMFTSVILALMLLVLKRKKSP